MKVVSALQWLASPLQTTLVLWVVVEIVASLVGSRINSSWSCGYPSIPPASSAPRSYGIPPVCVQHPTGPSRGIPCLRLATMACLPPPSGNSGMLGILSPPPSATIANNALTFKMPWEWGLAVALMFFLGIFAYLRKTHDQL